MAKKRNKQVKQEETPTWEKALSRISKGPLFQVEFYTGVLCNDRYPMARADWAYVTNTGRIYLNPRRDASVGEWEYIISHCLLHLGFGHFREDPDPLWGLACDLVVTKFLRDSHIGTPPVEFRAELPCAVRSEEQILEWLKEHHGAVPIDAFSTMSNGRPDMLCVGKSLRDYEKLFAASLQVYMLNSIRIAGGYESQLESYERRYDYVEARDWFLSSYPLLGGIAASFRIVDDLATVERMNIPVAAISPQMQEIYINKRCSLYLKEWKFVLAHEFLHAALRHDVRCEDRDPELWNVACDYVINQWLLEMKIGVMPEFGLYDLRFQGLSVETVYDLICEDIRCYRKENPGDMIYGDADWLDRPDGQELDATYRSALQRGLACHREQGRGYLPADLVEEIYAISRPPIHWDVELAKWFDENFPMLEKHRSYARLSRRQSATPDIPRPAWYMEEHEAEQRIFGVLLDTSGSMDRSLLAAALGSIASYAEARDVNNVRVVFCDAAPYDQGIMRPDEIAGRVEIRGRGGTVLQPGIDLLESDPKFPKEAPLLIITDGGCDRLNLSGREHAYLLPYGNHLPFIPKGPVFRLK